MQILLDKLIRLFKDLEKKAGDDYHRLFNLIELPKSTFLLKEGSICRHTWIIETGLARVFAFKGNTEVTKYFGFPGMFIDSYQSYLLQTPAKENIQLIEDSSLYAISKNEIDKLKFEYPEVTEIDRLMTECYAIWLEDRIFSIQFSTALERYRELLSSYPKLIHRIPLTYIASYLGVTLETLSRIR